MTYDFTEHASMYPSVILTGGVNMAVNWKPSASVNKAMITPKSEIKTTDFR